MLIALYGALSEPSHKLSQLLLLLGRRQFLVWITFTMIVAAAILVGAWLLKRGHLRDRPRWRLVRGMAYGALSGILSAHCLLIAKSAVELLVRTIVDKRNQFKYWQSWIILLALVALALTQLYYLHLGLKLCSTSVLYPFVFCVYNVIAIMDGLIYFRQVSRLSVAHAGLIALGTVILLSGVVALSWRLHGDEVGVDLPSASDVDASTPLLGHTRARSSTTAASLAPGLYLVANPGPPADEAGEDTHASSQTINAEEAHAATAATASPSPAATETSPLLPGSATSAKFPKFTWFSRHGRKDSQNGVTDGPETQHLPYQRSRRSSRTLPSILRRPRRPVTVHETAELWAELNDDCDAWYDGRKSSGGNGYYAGRAVKGKRRSTSGASFALTGGDDDDGDRAGNGLRTKRRSGDGGGEKGWRLDRRASSGGYLSTKSGPAAVGVMRDPGQDKRDGRDGRDVHGGLGEADEAKAQQRRHVYSREAPITSSTSSSTIKHPTNTSSTTSRRTSPGVASSSNSQKSHGPDQEPLSSSSPKSPSSILQRDADPNSQTSTSITASNHPTSQNGKTIVGEDDNEDDKDNDAVTEAEPSTLRSLWNKVTSGAGRYG